MEKLRQLLSGSDNNQMSDISAYAHYWLPLLPFVNIDKTNMENDCAFANLEDKYTFKLKNKSLHWTLFTNTCLAPPNLRAIHS